MKKIRLSNLILAALLVISVSCNTKNKKSNQEDAPGPEVETTSSSANGHNSKNALDWAGTYTGMIPCADCEGIKTTVTILENGEYTRTMTYIGKSNDPIKDNGKFMWNEQGSMITLTDNDGNSQQYQVGENILFHLDKEGNRIDGDLAKNYQLMKNHTDTNLEDKKWVLVELLGQKIEDQEDDKPIHITFNGTLGQMNGYNGCNLFVGPYTLKQGLRIEVGMMANTLMACENMETAQKFMEVLQKMDNYAISENTLSLNKARMAPLARFELSSGEE